MDEVMNALAAGSQSPVTGAQHLLAMARSAAAHILTPVHANAQEALPNSVSPASSLEEAAVAAVAMEAASRNIEHRTKLIDPDRRLA